MSARRGGWKGIGTFGCWFAAAMLALSGLGSLLLPMSWPNDRVAGALTVMAAPLLMPPVLARLRARAAWMHPFWVPVLLAMLIHPIALVISRPFTPTGKARVRLRTLAASEARQKIAAGDLRIAQARLDRFSDDHDPTIDRLLTEITAARAKKSPAIAAPTAPPSPAFREKLQDAASMYAERVETYWLPQARALPDAPPAESATFGTLLTQIDGLFIDAAEGSALSLTAAQQANRSKLMAVLSEKQAKLLPAMRRDYAKALDAKLFRDDMRVAAQGTTLTLTGGMFVRNANVEDMQTELSSMVNQLRFRRVVYRWSQYNTDGLRYDLDPPADRKLGRWNGTAFVAVRD